MHHDFILFQLSFPHKAVFGIEPEPRILVQCIGIDAVMIPQYRIDTLYLCEGCFVPVYAFLIKACAASVRPCIACITALYTA